MSFARNRRFALSVTAVLEIAFNLSYATAYLGNDVRIVTYGEPCARPSNLPFGIEKPITPMPERISKIYRPIRTSYRVIPSLEIDQTPRCDEYPIVIDVPEIPSSFEEPAFIATDRLRGKVYGYNVEILPVKTMHLRAHNVEVQIPPPPRASDAHSAEPVKRLTGLRSTIDRILVPACEINSYETHGCSSCS